MVPFELPPGAERKRLGTSHVCAVSKTQTQKYTLLCVGPEEESSFFLVQRSCTSLSVLTSVSVQKAQPSKETPKRRSCKKEVRRRLRSAVAVPRAHLAQQKAAKGPKRKTDIWRPPAEQLFFLACARNRWTASMPGHVEILSMKFRPGDRGEGTWSPGVEKKGTIRC